MPFELVVVTEKLRQVFAPVVANGSRSVTAYTVRGNIALPLAGAP